MKHTLFFYRALVMEYNIERLQQIKEEVAKLKGPLRNELHYLITRCIIIKQELEELDKIFATPERTEEDIIKHIRLVKEYKQNRDRQIVILQHISADVQNISAGLAEDYQETIDLIKA